MSTLTVSKLSREYLEARVCWINDAHVIPLNDYELPVLAANRDRIVKSGAQLLLSDPNVVETAFDKWDTMRFAAEIGVAYPATFLSQEAALDMVTQGGVRFPLVVKPRRGSGSVGYEIVEDETELKIAFELVKRKSLRELARYGYNDLSDPVIIQEKLYGDEYGVDILNDFKGGHIATFARRKLRMRAGETDRAVSVADPRITLIGEKIARALRHTGNLDCDLFDRNGEFYLLDMNPRFGGGYPFSHEAGADIASVYLELLREGRDFDRFLDYKPDMVFSKYDRLVRVG